MKKLSLVASCVAAVALQSAAFASGFHATSLVSVLKSSSGGSASGSVQSARYYATDNLQYIGCLSASDTKSSIYVYCAARDAHNSVLTCYSTTADQQARQAVAAVNQLSNIYFAVNSAGKCTYITVGNFSYAL
jgi:hypothetical protein